LLNVYNFLFYYLYLSICGADHEIPEPGGGGHQVSLRPGVGLRTGSVSLQSWGSGSVPGIMLRIRVPYRSETRIFSSKQHEHYIDKK
jgi:hypothetical protein